MKNAYSAFMAFFIPFSAAILLMALGSYFFQDWKFKNQPVVQSVSSQSEGKNLSFAADDWSRKPLDVEYLYGLFIISLFILSFTLPLFVFSRSEPIKRTEIKLS